MLNRFRTATPSAQSDASESFAAQNPPSHAIVPAQPTAITAPPDIQNQIILAVQSENPTDGLSQLIQYYLIDQKLITANRFIELTLPILIRHEQSHPKVAYTLQNVIRVFKLTADVVDHFRQLVAKEVQDQAPGVTAPQTQATAHSEFTQIKLDRDSHDLGLLAQLGHDIQKIYNGLDFKSVQFVGPPILHLRIIRLMYTCKLEDFVRFSSMSSDKIRFALKYLGIEDPTFCSGLHGQFEIQIPMPERFWRHVQFQELLPFNAQGHVIMADPCKPPVIPVGINMSNQTVQVSLLQPVLYAGATRSGKSNLARLMMLFAALCYDPSHICLVMIDLRIKSFKKFDGLSHLWNGQIITDTQTAIFALKTALEEYKRRDRLFASAGFDNIWEYNEHQKSIGEPLAPTWLIVLEEIDTLKRNQNKETVELLDELMDEGCKTTNSNGIHWLFGVHTATQKTITTHVRDECMTRIVLHCKGHASQYALDDTTIKGKVGEHLVGKGDCWVSYTGRSLERAQVAIVSEAILTNTLEALRNRYQGRKPVFDQKPTWRDLLLPKEREEYEKAINESGASDSRPRNKTRSTPCVDGPSANPTGTTTATRTRYQARPKSAVKPTEGNHEQIADSTVDSLLSTFSQ